MSILSSFFPSFLSPSDRHDIILTHLLPSPFHTQTALAEPNRVRLLHRARGINDAHHAISKAATDADNAGASPEERREKIIAAAPPCLKGRVASDEVLPQVEVVQMQSPRNGEEAKPAAAAEYVVMDGKLPGEVFVELMEMMLPKWDDERRRR